MLSSLKELQEELGRILRKLSVLETEVKVVQAGPSLSVGGSPTPGSPRPDLERINRFVEQTAAVESQQEILNAYLAESQRYLERGVLFVRQNSHFNVHQTFGFSTPRIEEVSITSHDDPIFRAADGLKLIEFHGSLETSVTWLTEAEPSPQQGVVIPFIFKDSVPVVFYGDSSREIDVESLQILTSMTTLTLQNHYLGYLHQGERARTVATQPVEEEVMGQLSEAEGETASPPGPEAGAAPVDTEPVSGKEEMAPVLSEAEPDAVAQEAEPERGDDGSGGVPTEETEAEPPGHAPADFGLQADEFEEFLDHPEPTVEEADTESADEEALHAESRRFARLLVTEIKLYNEDQVTEGRASNDLYQRLKNDIDRSRDMYEKRAHRIVKSQIDYFDAEIVRVLAEENRELMGDDYPGAHITPPASENETSED
jgi:hypothetical protein